MRAVVVASGELPSGYDTAVRSTLQQADLVIAADGGLRHCAYLGVWPDEIIGDLDSATGELVAEAQRNGATVQQHPTDKDATDLELAMDAAVDAGATEVAVVAAFGGRLDHELATVAMLSSDRWQHIAISADDGRRQLWVLRSRIDLALPVGHTVSLVPVAQAVDGVTTRGLQWPLTNARLDLGTTLGVSNVASDPTQSVEIASGTLLVIVDALEAHLDPS